MEKHDVIIVGGGPAGLTAGLYAARSRMDILLLEKLTPGGQVLTTAMVENYPGFEEAISGSDLVAKMEKQARGFGLQVEIKSVEKIAQEGSLKKMIADGEEYLSKAVIVATGVEPKLLGIPGEKELRGKGVSYCATCDGPFFRDKEVVVIGGGDSAVEEAIYLTRFAKRVRLIHRRDQLRAAKIVQERAFSNEKVEVVWDTVATRINGEQFVQSVDVKNVKTGREDNVETSGIFLYVGVKPNSDLFDFKIDADQRGFLRTDENMRTSVEGIYAVGDVRSKQLRQIVTATGEGATAAFAVQKYLEDLTP
ncbi:MAG: thioredoxin reductase [candidate division Zixibacteria bacterium SM23_81]|nr:MAG: thioredoxin reductase [candidate division Zixibacteria bacterium SM23_81]